MESKDILDGSAKDVNHCIHGGRELKVEDSAQPVIEFKDKLPDIGMRSLHIHVYTKEEERKVVAQAYSR